MQFDDYEIVMINGELKMAIKGAKGKGIPKYLDNDKMETHLRIQNNLLYEILKKIKTENKKVNVRIEGKIFND